MRSKGTLRLSRMIREAAMFMSEIATKGYLLRTLKSFAILIISFERQFRSLNTFDHINAHYVRPVSEIFPPMMSVWG